MPNPMMHRWRHWHRWRYWRHYGLAVVAAAAVVAVAWGRHSTPSPAQPETADALSVASVSPPTYQTFQHPQSLLHVVTIPNPQQFPLEVALADSLEPVDVLAQRHGAIAAINAGFFDPQNGQTTSFVLQAGQLTADPRQNQRLMGNPDLVNRLEQILNRSEFRRYRCADGYSYAIELHSTAPPEGCQLEASVGAGPQLLPQNTALEEAFIDYRTDGTVSRDALGSRFGNARSAVGIKPDGAVVLVLAAQQPGRPGLSFAEMAQFLQSLGVEAALNLDGGSSASLFFAGQTHYGRLDSQGNFVQRPVKSILWVNKSQ